MAFFDNCIDLKRFTSAFLLWNQFSCLAIYILNSLNIQYFHGMQQYSEKYQLFTKMVLITDPGPITDPLGRTGTLEIAKKAIRGGESGL